MPAATADILRTRLQSRRRVIPAPWRRPELSDFRQFRYVLAFDATLTNCGWAMLAVLLGKVAVLGKGTIRPRTEETGYLATWDKADRLRQETDQLIYRWTRIAHPHCDLAVEAPPVGGGHRVESTLIAGMVVWMARPGTGCDVISPTHVSAVLLGDPKIKSEDRKPAIREAVVRLCPETAGRDWNEHERDAMSVGLTHLWDLRREPLVPDAGIAV